MRYQYITVDMRSADMIESAKENAKDVISILSSGGSILSAVATSAGVHYIMSVPDETDDKARAEVRTDSGLKSFGA